MKKIMTCIVALIMTCALVVPAFAGEAAGTKMGQIDGDQYINESINLKFIPADGWKQYSEEEIAAQNGIAEEIFKDSEAMQDYVASATTWIDMFAEGPDSSSANVALQKLDDTQKKALEQVSIRDIAAAQDADMVSMLESGGYQDVSFTIDDSFTDFFADDYACIFITGKVMGIDTFLRQVIYQVGDHLVTITVGSNMNDNTLEYMGYFSAADAE